MVTASRPSASAVAVAASTTASTLSPRCGPRRRSEEEPRHSSCRVRAGSPELVRSVGTGPSSRTHSLYDVHCTAYREYAQRDLGGVFLKITSSAVSLNVDDVPASSA